MCFSAWLSGIVVGDLLINVFIVLLPWRPINKYLELCGTFHQHSSVYFGKFFCEPSFSLLSSPFIQYSSIPLSHSLSLPPLRCLSPPPPFCLPLDKWSLCLLVKWTWKQWLVQVLLPNSRNTQCNWTFMQIRFSICASLHQFKCYIGMHYFL